MAAELHAPLLDLPQVRQREHLEPAAVGEDGPVPAHEFMQAARLLHQRLARAQVQVVGVGEYDLRAAVLQLLRRHGLDRGLGAHRHEHRRLDDPVRGVKPPAPRAGPLVNVQKLEFKGGGHGRDLRCFF